MKTTEFSTTTTNLDIAVDVAEMFWLAFSWPDLDLRITEEIDDVVDHEDRK